MEPKEGQMKRAQTLGSIKTRLRRIAETARENPEMVFTNLAHNIDPYFLGEAFRRTRKGGAVGVDGVRGKDYGENLSENVKDLWQRMKSRTYKPQPVRRVHIPKGKGETRPIGIPTFEDKVAQQEAWIEELQNRPKPEPERMEVAVIPDQVSESMAELAARAEALAEAAEEKLRAAG